MSTNSFAYDSKSFNVAKVVTSKFDEESMVVRYLHESRPPFLKIGDSWLSLDKQTLEKEIKGLSDKLKIHGYSDRGERLQYLHFVLTQKLVEKEDSLKTIIKFLLEMSERPTAVIRVDLGTKTYSLQPDQNIKEEEDYEKQKELLRQLLLDADETDQEPISYSSDSELSDWTTEDEESEKSKKSTNEIVEPNRNLKPSRSFSEFSDLPLMKDHEEKRKEMELYWTMEEIRAQNFLSDIRKVTITPLQCQPVISGLLTLQSKFGEHWEWKKKSIGRVDQIPKIVSEEDVIREILWQFSALNPSASPIFTDDWNVIPGLMTSSLSVSSFAALMKVYVTIFTSLTKFKNFVNFVENRSSSIEHPPKMFRTYAQGLSQIILRIAKDVGGIERNLRKVSVQPSLWEEDHQPCTTLIQLGMRLKSFKDNIAMLDRIHSLSNISTLEVGSNSSDEWFSSIRLMHCLAMNLSLETKPIQFGILLFLFCKCLHAFLDEISLALNTLTWNEDQFLFVRDRSTKLSDSNFWSDSITLRPYEEKLKEIGIPVIKSFFKLFPDLLIVFKTSEMLSHLEEDFKKILGEPPCSMTIVANFLNALLPQWDGKDESKRIEMLLPDYKTHFKFIGMEGSIVTDSAKYILSPQQGTRSTRRNQHITELDRFLSLTEVPTANLWNILDSVLIQSYAPHCERAKNCIHKIFIDYQVDESMKMFREIILGVREDFAKSIIELSSKSSSSNRYRYEDEMNRNPRFQKLLNDCYPEGRDNFSIEFKLDSSSDMNYTFVVTPHFPLNLILTSQCIGGYLFVSKQLHRIRKSLWELTSLNIKEFKVIDDVEPNRVLLFRFALIHFCSNIRAYLVFKIFAKDLSVSTTQSYDLDNLRKAHEDHLQEIETKLLRSQVMEHVIIRKIVSMSEVVNKFWIRGIPNKSIVLLEDTLKKCWNVVKTFHRSNYSTDFNELSFHFGPPPSYL